jgi:hypothetical protein
MEARRRRRKPSVERLTASRSSASRRHLRRRSCELISRSTTTMHDPHPFAFPQPRQERIRSGSPLWSGKLCGQIREGQPRFGAGARRRASLISCGQRGGMHRRRCGGIVGRHPQAAESRPDGESATKGPFPVGDSDSGARLGPGARASRAGPFEATKWRVAEARSLRTQ